MEFTRGMVVGGALVMMGYLLPHPQADVTVTDYSSPAVEQSSDGYGYDYDYSYRDYDGGYDFQIDRDGKIWI